MLIDSILLLGVQYYRSKEEHKKEMEQKQFLLEQSRFFSIGQTIGNITHQWNAPLTQLGTSLTMIEVFVKKDSPNLKESVENSLPKMQNMVKLMRATLQEFSQFYQTNMVKENYSPLELIKNQVFVLVESKRVLKNATIKLDIPDNLEIYGYGYQLSNILLVLLNNSLDAFSALSDENTIVVKIEKISDEVHIWVSDNAGGITVKPIERVFEYFVSSKTDDKKGHGIGLAMVKMLVQEQLNGTITAKNKDGGAEFIIIFLDS
jgi:C4-dicarboxylate-specific signal transduction histidine kinase